MCSISLRQARNPRLGRYGISIPCSECPFLWPIISQTFCMTAELHPRYAPSFRLFPRDCIFLRDFYSDRSHMLDKYQTWRQPPPPWPPIMPNVPQPLPLLRIIAMQDPPSGPFSILANSTSASYPNRSQAFAKKSRVLGVSSSAVVGLKNA